MNIISVASLHQLLTGNPLALVIDVRTREEHQKVSVAGTSVLPLSEIRPEEVNALSGSTGLPVYLLCTSGARSKLAVERLEISGFNNSIVVEGGLAAWQKAGLPVIKGQSRGFGRGRRVRIAAAVFIFLGALLAITTSPVFLALSGVAGLGWLLAGVSGGAVQETQKISSIASGQWVEM